MYELWLEQAISDFLFYEINDNINALEDYVDCIEKEDICGGLEEHIFSRLDIYLEDCIPLFITLFESCDDFDISESAIKKPVDYLKKKIGSSHLKDKIKNVVKKKLTGSSARKKIKKKIVAGIKAGVKAGYHQLLKAKKKVERAVDDYEQAKADTQVQDEEFRDIRDRAERARNQYHNLRAVRHFRLRRYGRPHGVPFGRR